MPDKNLSGICGYVFFAKYMRTKILSKRGLLIAVPTGFVLFQVFIFSFASTNSMLDISVLPIENDVTFSNQEQTNVGLPVRLKIPVIKVDSTIIPVGLTPDGAMDAPKDPAEVAWFNLGARPGENGTAVIDGHYDWINNMSAVFDNLHKLRKDDKIFVEDEKGAIYTFVVREIRIYNKDAEASDVFISNDSSSHLNLITCTGSWEKTEKTFSERLIIFTDKEN